MTKYVINGGKTLNGEVTISGAKNAAVAIVPAALLADGPVRIENVPKIIDVTLQLEIMRELGAQDIPMLVILNKCDLVADVPRALNQQTALISARTGFGFDMLLQKTSELLAPTHRRVTLMLPYDKTGLISEIMASGKVYAQTYEPEGTRVDALVDLRLLHKVSQWRV